MAAAANRGAPATSTSSTSTSRSRASEPSAHREEAGVLRGGAPARGPGNQPCSVEHEVRGSPPQRMPSVNATG